MHKALQSRATPTVLVFPSGLLAFFLLSLAPLSVHVDLAEGIAVSTQTAHAQLWDEAAGLVGCGNMDNPEYRPYYADEQGRICYVRGGAYGECSFCDLVRLAQSILNFLIFAGVLVAVLLFLNAGILYIGAASNPGNVAKSHKIILNTVVGLLLILATWLIVDVIMKTLYGDEDAAFGPWNQILCKGEFLEPYCITPREGIPFLEDTVVPNIPPPAMPLPSGKGYCSAEVMRSMGWPESAMALGPCICHEESRGKADIPSGADKCEPGGEYVSWGLWQLNLSTERFPGCTSNPFSGYYTGKPSSHWCTVINPGMYVSCIAAAKDPAVNTAYAIKLYNSRGWQPWTNSYNKCTR